jgi:hypothetical protein
VPRILFFDAAGKHMEAVVQREDKYKYFHYDPSTVAEAMKKAVKMSEEESAVDKIEKEEL